MEQDPVVTALDERREGRVARETVGATLDEPGHRARLRVDEIDERGHRVPLGIRSLQHRQPLRVGRPGRVAEGAVVPGATGMRQQRWRAERCIVALPVHHIKVPARVGPVGAERAGHIGQARAVGAPAWHRRQELVGQRRRDLAVIDSTGSDARRVAGDLGQFGQIGQLPNAAVQAGSNVGERHAPVGEAGLIEEAHHPRPCRVEGDE